MAELRLSDLGAHVTPAPSIDNLGGYGPRALPSGYNTRLGDLDEMAFRSWLSKNNVPFNAAANVTDYDMRGFYQATQQQQPGMSSAVNPVDGRVHYPDRFKTPLHRSFSSESQWAGRNAPQWIDEARLAAPSGRVVFDERQR